MAKSINITWKCDVCSFTTETAEHKAPVGWTDFAWEHTEAYDQYEREYSNERTVCNNCAKKIYVTLIYNGNPPDNYLGEI